MFPLSQSVPGISNRCSVISKLARGITKSNLTRRHGTLIVSVPGHEVRQDTATFMLRLTDEYYNRCCWSTFSSNRKNV